jgi:hypothetical protein
VDLTPIIIASAVLVCATGLVASISLAMRSVEARLQRFCDPSA